MLVDKHDPYFWPVPEERLKAFFGEIIRNCQEGFSGSITFPFNAGGARAWFKFFLTYPELFNQLPLKKMKFVYLDPAEIYPRSSLGYLHYLFQALTGESLPLETISFLALRELLAQQLKLGLKKYDRLVIFLAKVDELEFWDKDLANSLFFLWTLDKFRINLIAVWNHPIDFETAESFMDRLMEAVWQKLIQVPLLTTKEIEWSIKRWEKWFGFQVDDPDYRQTIVSLSQGLPYLVKLMVQYYQDYRLLKQKPKPKEFLLQQPILQRLLSGGSAKQLTLTPEGDLQLGQKSVAFLFGPKEFAVLKFLLRHQNQLVTRDQIAQILWGKKTWERYSDWAISQMMASIRRKLNSLGIADPIIPVRGQGYLLKSQKAND